MATQVNTVFHSSKVQDGVQRSFTIPSELHEGAYKFINEKLSELFKESITENVDLSFRWKDEDGDLVVCTSEEETQEALKSAKNGQFQIYVQAHEMPTDPQGMQGKIDFPMDANGEFVPPPRFRRWMNRYTRRWHKRNCCPYDLTEPDSPMEEHKRRSRHMGRRRRMRSSEGVESGAEGRGRLHKCRRRRMDKEVVSEEKTEEIGGNSIQDSETGGREIDCSHARKHPRRCRRNSSTQEDIETEQGKEAPGVDDRGRGRHGRHCHRRHGRGRERNGGKWMRRRCTKMMAENAANHDGTPNETDMSQGEHVTRMFRKMDIDDDRRQFKRTMRTNCKRLAPKRRSFAKSVNAQSKV